jgi:hypothetical protein
VKLRCTKKGTDSELELGENDYLVHDVVGAAA